MSPFELGTRVVVRVAGGGEMAVGAIDAQQPDVWTIRLAERVNSHEFPPGVRLVLTAAVDGGLWVARSQLLRRSDAMFVVARPRLTDRRDRRRDQRVEASGTVAWSARVWTGSAPALDVSRSGLKLAVRAPLRVGEVMMLDIAGAGRVSAMVVGLTPTAEAGVRFAHLAFLRADDDLRTAVMAALAVPAMATSRRLNRIDLAPVASGVAGVASVVA